MVCEVKFRKHIYNCPVQCLGTPAEDAQPLTQGLHRTPEVLIQEFPSLFGKTKPLFLKCTFACTCNYNILLLEGFNLVNAVTV